MEITYVGKFPSKVKIGKQMSQSPISSVEINQQEEKMNLYRSRIENLDPVCGMIVEQEIKRKILQVVNLKTQ